MNYTTEETGKKLRDLGFEPTDKSWLWSLDEVLDRLPAKINLPDGNHSLLELLKCVDWGYRISYVGSNKHAKLLRESVVMPATVKHENPAEAAAQLLIKLVQCGHIKKEN